MRLNKFLIIGLLLFTLIAIPISFASDISVYDVDANYDNNLNESLAINNVEDSNLDNDNVSISNLSDSNSISYNDENTIYVRGNYSGEEKGTSLNPYSTINAAFDNIINSSKSNLFIFNGNYTLVNEMNITKNVNIIGESTEEVIIDCNMSIAPFRVFNSNVSFSNLTIYNGYSNSGFTLVYGESANLNLSNLIFNQSYAESPGGILLIQSGSLNLDNVSIINSLINYTSGISGGIIYSNNSNLVIRNSYFKNNTVISKENVGGFIYAEGILTIDNTSFLDTSIDSEYIEGGLIFINTYKYGVCEISNCTIINISEDYVYGSLIYNYGCLNLNLNNTRIENVSVNNSYGDFLVYDARGKSYLNNCTVINNTIVTVLNDLSYSYNSYYLNDAFEDIIVDLPDSYDLRNITLADGTNVTWITSVKNQGSCSSCWAFATIAAIESYLLKYENITYDFSENNMKNIMSMYNEDNGSQWNTNDKGGNEVLSLAYLLRWSGLVNESDDPYNSSSKNSNNFDAIKHVQGVKFIPLRSDYLDNDQIKKAILEYGALYVPIYWDDIYALNCNYYCYDTVTSNHAVTLVGWDDNYSADNFNVTPPGDGAFIIKNSWGSSVGDNGYYYISYYDNSFAGFGLTDTFSALAFTSVENATNYGYNYQYDIFGNDYYSLGYQNDTAWFANQYTAISDNPLSAVGFYTYGSSNYSIYIYVNDELVHTQNGNVTGAGYNTIKLDNLVNLTEEDIFKIAIKLTTPNCLYPIAIQDSIVNFIKISQIPEYNQSFVSFDGENWVDLHSIKLYENASVCLKAYTVNVCDVSCYFDDDTITYNEGDLVNITICAYNSGDLTDLTVLLNLSDGMIIENVTKTCGEFDNNSLIWTIHSMINDDADEYNDENKYALYLTVRMNTSSYESFVNMTWNTSTKNSNEDNYYSFSLFKQVNATLDANSTSITYKSGIPYSIQLKPDVENISVENLVINYEIYKSGEDSDCINVGFGYTDKNGMVYIYLEEPIGSYIVNIICEDKNFNVSKNCTVNITKATGKLSTSKVTTYYKQGKLLSVNLTNSKTGKPISDESLTLKIGSNTYTIKTNSKGVATYNTKSLAPGTYTAKISLSNTNINASTISTTITVKKSNATITPYSYSSYYNSGAYFKVKLVDKNTKQVLEGVKLRLKVYTTSSKYKYYYVTTNASGIAQWKVSGLAIGSHKVYVSSYNSYVVSNTPKSTIKITKIPTTVSAPKVTAKYKSATYFKITVKNSKTSKLISSLKIRLRIYTGSKYKTVYVTTNSKGVASYKLSSLSKGTHKIVMASYNSKYSLSATGYVVIIK